MNVFAPICAAIVAAAGTAAAITVSPLDLAGYEALVSGAKGRILVVNMWATWCEPCREEFPDLVRLQRDLAGRGVEFAVISMDMSDQIEPAVIPFLRSQDVRFRTFIKAPGGDDAFINGVDPTWSGALPATFVYDRSGRLAAGLKEPITYETLEQTILPLLPAAKP